MTHSDHSVLPLSDISGQRVVAAMSGGVDSSVCALLLVQSGAHVMGATMRLFGNDDISTGEADGCDIGCSFDNEPEECGSCCSSDDQSGESNTFCSLDDEPEECDSCCSSDDVADAKAVCQRLGIEHQTLNFRQDFAEKVIDPFCQSYLAGETPNPCIDCNRHLKFDTLQRFRAQMSYEFVATGHYVRRSFNPKTGRYELRMAANPAKDQSYVLYSLTQEQLAHTLFPLGELSKDQVRAIAAEEGFENAQKPESQDICFVPDGDYVSFIQNRTGKTIEPGEIVDADGHVLGEHTGLACYTIGQRRGIGVAGPEPLYVCGKNLVQNQLVVGTREKTLITKVEVSNVNFVSVASFEGPTQVQAKIRYRQQAKLATVVQTDPTSVEIIFHEPVCATAPGQAAVIYKDDLVLAGGTIVSCS